jgi:hypothetical protein
MGETESGGFDDGSELLLRAGLQFDERRLDSAPVKWLIAKGRILGPQSPHAQKHVDQQGPQ